MKKLSNLSFTVCALLLVSLLPANGSQEKQDKNGKDMVYVCACLKNRSCACMTEAKTPGPCACGTEGGPPLKAVPKNSDWAKENRKELSK